MPQRSVQEQRLRGEGGHPRVPGVKGRMELHQEDQRGRTLRAKECLNRNNQTFDAYAKKCR